MEVIVIMRRRDGSCDVVCLDDILLRSTHIVGLTLVLDRVVAAVEGLLLLSLTRALNELLLLTRHRWLILLLLACHLLRGGC